MSLKHSNDSMVFVMYINGLNNSNYRLYIDDIKSSIRIIINSSETSLTALSKLTGVNRITIFRVFGRKNEKSLAFISAKRLNDFVKKVTPRQDLSVKYV